MNKGMYHAPNLQYGLSIQLRKTLPKYYYSQWNLLDQRVQKPILRSTEIDILVCGLGCKMNIDTVGLYFRGYLSENCQVIIGAKLTVATADRPAWDILRVTLDLFHPLDSESDSLGLLGITPFRLPLIGMVDGMVVPPIRSKAFKEGQFQVVQEGQPSIYRQKYDGARITLRAHGKAMWNVN